MTSLDQLPTIGSHLDDLNLSTKEIDILTKNNIKLKAIDSNTTVGIEVYGIDLKNNKPSKDLQTLFERIMAERGIAVFKHQFGDSENSDESNKCAAENKDKDNCNTNSFFKNRLPLSGKSQVQISEYFGPIHSTHGVHPLAPNKHIFRLSNDPEQGILGVGPQWHNDGSFLETVFGYVGYYIVHAPKSDLDIGETFFASTWRAYEKLTEKEKQLWDNRFSVNSNGGAVHPMTYKHNISGRRHVYLHLGMTGAVVESRIINGKEEGSSDSAKPKQGFKLLTDPEMRDLFHRYNDLLNDPSIHVKHKYEPGDFVIIDNLSVSHKAAPSAHKKIPGSDGFSSMFRLSNNKNSNNQNSQVTTDGDGQPNSDHDSLRILHRTTISGRQPHHATEILGDIGYLNIDAPHPFNKDGVWESGGLGYRWDESIRMQN